MVTYALHFRSKELTDEEQCIMGVSFEHFKTNAPINKGDLFNFCPTQFTAIRSEDDFNTISDVIQRAGVDWSVEEKQFDFLNRKLYCYIILRPKKETTI